MPSLDMDTGRSYAAPFSAIAHVLSFTRKIRRLKSLGVFHENKRADFFQLANLDKMRFLAVLLGRQSNLFQGLAIPQYGAASTDAIILHRMAVGAGGLASNSLTSRVRDPQWPRLDTQKF
jgi:hypothetical protein